MGFLRAKDTVSGQEGKATIIANGQVIELFDCKSIEATMEKTKEDVKTIGNRALQKKTVGWEGTGSMTMHYVSSQFRKLAIEYAKTGRDFYFTLTIVNDDPTTSIGKQTIVLYDCNFDSVILAKLDVDSAVLEEDMDFTFSGVDMLDEFGQPILD